MGLIRGRHWSFWVTIVSNATCRGTLKPGSIGTVFVQNKTLSDREKNILRVLDAVENQLMPPEDALQPAHEQRAQFVEWIKGNLFTGACCDGNQSSPVVIRRLNRQEYDNTLRDWIGLELKLSQDFPPDDSGFGFDKVGSALNTSPLHVERYLLAAEKAMQAAIRVPSIGDLPPIELILPSRCRRRSYVRASS